MENEDGVKVIEAHNPYAPKDPKFTVEYSAWYTICISFILWALFYQALGFLLPQKSREYRCRILSFFHGLLTAFVGINQCFLIDYPFQHPEWRTTTSQKFLMVCSLGYFIHDLGWLMVYDRSSKLMTAHHVYSVIALLRMLNKDRSGAQACCGLGSMEITNPMLQIRWFIRSEGFYPSMLYSCVEITFMFIFFVVRIVLGTYFFFVIVLEPKNDWEFRLLALSIYVMSWMFFYNIGKYLINKYGFGIKDRDIRSKGT